MVASSSPRPTIGTSEKTRSPAATSGSIATQAGTGSLLPLASIDSDRSYPITVRVEANGSPLPLGGHGSGPPFPDPRPGGGEGLLSHQDRTDRRVRLQSRGRVDHVPG